MVHSTVYQISQFRFTGAPVQSWLGQIRAPNGASRAPRKRVSAKYQRMALYSKAYDLVIVTRLCTRCTDFSNFRAQSNSTSYHLPGFRKSRVQLVHPYTIWLDFADLYYEWCTRTPRRRFFREAKSPVHHVYHIDRTLQVCDSKMVHPVYQDSS